MMSPPGRITFPILAAGVATNIIQVYVRMTLQRRWRAWLNDHLIDRWVTNGRYYHLDLTTDSQYTIANGTPQPLSRRWNFAISPWTCGA